MQAEVSPSLVKGTLDRSDSEQGSEPYSQLREMAMEASHRIPQDPPSAGRRSACHRPRIIQALLEFGCGDLSIRQHSFLKNRDGGMAPRAAVALQPCCEAFSWRPSVPMHLSRPQTRTTSWRQSADISLSNLHAQKQNKWMRRISSESLWGNPKIDPNKSAPLGK